MTLLLSPDFRKDVGKLPAKDRRRIRDALLDFRDRERGDTRKIGEGLWRLHVGDYRIYYSPKGSNTCVPRLVHRSRAYRSETINALLRRIASLDGKTDDQQRAYQATNPTSHSNPCRHLILF